ncbi:MAG: 2-C-methyl-D-erythritol 2,4-cyclodiphosphate synthase [Opitutales bacterium]|jgi:2-C-methyl-D-erythritol 4-phosphate cytidylyltransferase/2-C-methyl-D-erythritol 2,4-cyclodiphosphate synthase
MMHVAILLAGGSGSRMSGSVEDKVLVEIGNAPVFAHVLRAFKASQTQDMLVVVARNNAQRKELEAIVNREQPGVPVYFTIGGGERQDSVRAGLELVPSSAKWVTIHDCARPAVTPGALKAVRKTLLALNSAVSLAHRVTDTVRFFQDPPLDSPGHGQLLDRTHLWAMETPQAFPRELIDQAHQSLKSPVTDDLAAVEALGQPVAIVESTHPNPKLTRPADLALLESILAPEAMNHSSTQQTRVGFGYDIHQLRQGLPLVLGGVSIQSEVGLVGHSDADVLSHAIADAILGACGLPDIGHYFPNTDPQIKGISSQEILRRARKEAAKTGMRLVNVDASLIAETPKISPYLREMKSVLAKTLKLNPSDIGIKATTQEKIGALGAGEGIAAQAVATLSGQRKC